MFEGLTANEIETRVKDIQSEKARLVSDLKKVVQNITSIRSEIDHQDRTYSQYLMGYKSLKKAPIVQMATYAQVTETINEIVSTVEPKEAEEKRARDDADQLRTRIAQCDAALVAAEEASSKACKVYYGRFGPRSAAPGERG